MAGEPERLARGLAHHVHQPAQRLDSEPAYRPRGGRHLDGKGRDLDRRRLGRAQERRDRRRLLEQDGMGAVEQLPEAGAAAVGPEVEHQRALGGVEELEERAFALRQQGRRAAHRIAARLFDLDHVGAEIGRDLGRER